MLARKFVSYRLHMAGTTQNKLKCLIFIVVPQGITIIKVIDNEIIIAIIMIIVIMLTTM